MDTLKGWTFEEFKEFFKKEKLKDKIMISDVLLNGMLLQYEPDDVFRAIESDLSTLKTHINTLEIPKKLFEYLLKSQFIYVNTSGDINFQTNEGPVVVKPYE